MEQPLAEMRARGRAHDLTGLLWHLGAFAIINASFWVLDLVVGQSGLQWAPWITGMWAFALAFHGLTYLILGRRMEDRLTETYLDDERERIAR